MANPPVQKKQNPPRNQLCHGCAGHGLRAVANQGGTGHWPVPSGDPPDGTGEALCLHAKTVSHRAPLSAQPGWQPGRTGHWPVPPAWSTLLPLARIFHSETGKTMANPCSAGFPACRIAGFQTCVPRLFNHEFARVCAPLFIGFFATLSKMAMKYPG